MEKYKCIESVDELKELALNENTEFFILLSGILRSSKTIRYSSRSKRFNIINDADNTYQEDLTEKELALKTNIVDAIEKKAFFQHLY